MIDWEFHGIEFANCNCAYGCPCQFNALPTQGNCRAVCFIRIDRGHFGTTRLDGLNMAFVAAWPGAVHEGHGTMQPIIDARADAAQRQALLGIMTGKETDEMATFFAIYTAMCDKIHDPVHTTIRIDLDMGARTAQCMAAGTVSGRGEPIRNAKTGKEQRAGIVLPDGFEYGQNECGRGWSTATGDLAIELQDSHAHWCELHFNRHGRIH
jgi:hypothetical protein